MATTCVTETNFEGLSLLHRGKVRDLYEVDGNLLLVATDRISAFDVVMDEPVPNKGVILTSLSLFWFDYLKDIMKHQVITADVSQYPAVCFPYREQLVNRSLLVKKAVPLPVECIVRGYLSGSFWQSYQKSSTICGIKLPDGMRQSEKFAQPIFTPSTKAEKGLHDENISMVEMENLVGRKQAGQIKDFCIRLYEKAALYAGSRGIIIADTKFELGFYNGELILIDEVLTPDSSRFWRADQYQPGSSQASFDKQFLRDYLAGLDWDKKYPPPALPVDILEKTADRYQKALTMITGC